MLRVDFSGIRKCRFLIPEGGKGGTETRTDHDVLLQHLQPWGAVGLQQCVDHLVQLCLLLSRDRIPDTQHIHNNVRVSVWAQLRHSLGRHSAACFLALFPR